MFHWLWQASLSAVFRFALEPGEFSTPFIIIYIRERKRERSAVNIKVKWTSTDRRGIYSIKYIIEGIVLNIGVHDTSVWCNL